MTIKITQQDVDAFQSELKTMMLASISENGSAATALVKDPDFSYAASMYELDTAPELRKLGFEVPTLAELLGVDITITGEPGQ